MESFKNGEEYQYVPETGANDPEIPATNGQNEGAIVHHLERADVQRALAHFARSLVRTTPGIEVADLLQDTMERAVRNASAYDPAREPLPWLETILYNRWHDLMQKKKRTVRMEGMLADETSMASQYEHNQSPEADAAINEEIKIAEEILNTLPPEQYKVFAMNVIEGKSPDEIASILGIPLGTVKGRLRLAREKIDRLKIKRLN